MNILIFVLGCFLRMIEYIYNIHPDINKTLKILVITFINSLFF